MGPELAALWAQAVSGVVEREGLSGAEKDALVTSAGAVFADASARLEHATRQGAVGELDAQVRELSRKRTRAHARANGTERGFRNARGGPNGCVGYSSEP
jgi:hypothetical protein